FAAAAVVLLAAFGAMLSEQMEVHLRMASGEKRVDDAVDKVGGALQSFRAPSSGNPFSRIIRSLSIHLLPDVEQGPLYTQSYGEKIPRTFVDGTSNTTVFATRYKDGKEVREQKEKLPDSADDMAKKLREETYGYMAPNRASDGKPVQNYAGNVRVLKDEK